MRIKMQIEMPTRTVKSISPNEEEKLQLIIAKTARIKIKLSWKYKNCNNFGWGWEFRHVTRNEEFMLLASE